MRRNRKSTILLLLGILALGLTLGYAYLNTTLNIDGTVNVSSANWNVYWDNIQSSSNNVTDVTTPATISTGKTEVTFNVNFSLPGDTYEFTVDAVNDGSIDAMVDIVTTGVYATNGITEKELPDYLEYTVTYSDGVAISQNHILKAGDIETYKVRVHYEEDINANQLPSTADNYMFKFSVTYIQKGPAGITRPTPYIYYANTANEFKIGNSVFPTALVFNNYQDAINSFGYDFFLKHKIENNVVKESYVGFILNGNVYYLKGGDNGESYLVNKEILQNAFGSSNCEEEGTYVCVIRDTKAVTRSNGYVGAYIADDNVGCEVSQSGYSVCTNGPT